MRSDFKKSNNCIVSNQSFCDYCRCKIKIPIECLNSQFCSNECKLKFGFKNCNNCFKDFLKGNFYEYNNLYYCCEKCLKSDSLLYCGCCFQVKRDNYFIYNDNLNLTCFNCYKKSIESFECLKCSTTQSIKNKKLIFGSDLNLDFCSTSCLFLSILESKVIKCCNCLSYLKKDKNSILKDDFNFCDEICFNHFFNKYPNCDFSLLNSNYIDILKYDNVFINNNDKMYCKSLLNNFNILTNDSTNSYLKNSYMPVFCNSDRLKSLYVLLKKSYCIIVSLCYVYKFDYNTNLLLAYDLSSDDLINELLDFIDKDNIFELNLFLELNNYLVSSK